MLVTSELRATVELLHASIELLLVFTELRAPIELLHTLIDPLLASTELLLASIELYASIELLHASTELLLASAGLGCDPSRSSGVWERVPPLGMPSFMPNGLVGWVLEGQQYRSRAHGSLSTLSAALTRLTLSRTTPVHKRSVHKRGHDPVQMAGICSHAFCAGTPKFWVRMPFECTCACAPTHGACHVTGTPVFVTKWP